MKTDLTTRKASLWTPELQAVVPAIQTGLEANYASVAVEVVACPDLTTLGCAAAGISGSTCLVDVGGEPYAHNPKYRDIELDTAKIAALCDHPEAAILGAGMAHRRMLDGHVGEWIPTLQLNGANRSKVARVGADKACVVEDYPSTLHSGLSNLFLSEGKRVPVIMIRVARRIGDQASFPQAIRQSLIDHLPVRNEQQLGVGGVFVVDAGRIRSHVSPDYECITHHYYDTKSERVVADFLQFYEHMGPDLVCLSVFWTGDPTGPTCT